MKRIRITPAWYFSDEAGNQLDPKLFGLLEAVHRHGKLTQAAEAVGISYRHAWNLLNKWGEFFGIALVDLERGKGARLSPLGEKLLWAEQRVIARLGPQLESLGSELNLAIQQTLEGVKPVLRLYATHGYAVELLPAYLDELRLDLQYCSSREALSALHRGACDLAGFHLPRGEVGKRVSRGYRDLLKPRSYRVIRFITRRQGLIVAPGNPLGVKGLNDLAKGEVRFINRQVGSGTRALLDGLLEGEGLATRRIRGYELEEYTHSAVAAYVAAGMAEVGFGVEAAARRFGLDFVPLALEDYLLVGHRRSLAEPKLQSLCQVIAGEAFQAAVAELPGYRPDRCGQVEGIESLLPD
ncbi:MULTISPECIES: substrate-binding domain-containing protein [Halomonas]|uniref:Formate dehydrogenase n=2 Tax=Halomonas TaxID=2745 RepID=A0ABQ0U017_9GAMM|nr:MULTISPECIES: substrate-binding domain-containing protein [Halomonas]PSJ21341.1 MolR family transcriptional regulator [Halomonas sp. ND22Bw]KGE77437.1 MolR family transcriptional regulator [Halomonas salina]MDR5889592.1 substrate-binding domain-containing protein [Halomonas salina]RAH39075.1 LysR family transcriptional regulator [Halomonas sp. SL1]WJY06274.1 substrate-binding domain-containing protein [Halomonas halophila]